MNDFAELPSYPKLLLGKTLARCYVDDHEEQFSDPLNVETGSFLQPKREYDEWVAYTYNTVNKLEGLDLVKVPRTGSPEWPLWVTFREKNRKRQNNASRIGQHGNPPYRMTQNTTLDEERKFKRGPRKGQRNVTRQTDKLNWRVDLEKGIAKTLFPTFRSDLERFVLNKKAYVEPERALIEERMLQGSLPLTLQIQWEMEKELEDMSVAQFVFSLEERRRRRKKLYDLIEQRNVQDTNLLHSPADDEDDDEDESFVMEVE